MNLSQCRITKKSGLDLRPRPPSFSHRQFYLRRDSLIIATIAAVNPKAITAMLPSISGTGVGDGAAMAGLIRQIADVSAAIILEAIFMILYLSEG